MAIRIKGTVGDVDVDLTVEGLDAATLQSLVGGAVNCEGESATEMDGMRADSVAQQSTASQQSNTSRQSEDPNDLAWRLALAEIHKQGEVLSFDLINALSSQGLDDSTIKKTLLYLRETGEVTVAHADDGLQRIYKAKTKANPKTK